MGRKLGRKSSGGSAAKHTQALGSFSCEEKEKEKRKAKEDCVASRVPTRVASAVASTAAAATAAVADERTGDEQCRPIEDPSSAARSAARSTCSAAPGRPLGCSEGEAFLRPVSDPAAVRACFEEHGVVAVTGCLSLQECERLVREGFEPYLPRGCHMDDVAAFSMADEVMNRYGVVGKTAWFNPMLLSARLHPNVVSAYSAVHGTDEVFACHDRFAWMRPTLTKAAWDTPFSWPGLHFDVSLRSYFQGSRPAVDQFLNNIDYTNGHFTAENNSKHASMGRTVQGVLNIFDNEEEDGGFQCVPGMHGAALEEWVSRHTGLPAPEVNGKYELKDFGPDRQLGKQAVRVPCPAGTLILFDATLPHGTRPNTSARSRAILFLRYLIATELPPEAWRDRNDALQRVVKSVRFEPDERQARHLYGPA